MLGDELVKAIREATQRDKKILKLAEAYDTGKADYYTARRISKLIGDNAARILEGRAGDILGIDDAYPGLMDMLREVWEESAAYAAYAQEAMNTAQGMQIKGLAARANMKNASGIASAGAKAESIEDFYLSVTEPVKLFSEMAVNETIEANSDFIVASGVKQVLTRNTYGKCCDWCDALEGSWEYGQQPADFFKQHENCKCVITARTEITKYRVNGRWNRGVGTSQKYTLTPKPLPRR